MDSKSIIIVGNGESVLKNKNGNYIDEFKTVVRLGRYVIDGYKEYVGSKTDIISTIYWKLNIERLKKHKVILNVPISLQEEYLKCELFVNKEYKDYINNILYINKEEDVNNICNFYKKIMPSFKEIYDVNFSLGFKTFYFMDLLFPDYKIYTTGFDFFKTGWYWDTNHNRDVANLHPYIWERMWYKTAIKNGIINEL